MHSEQNLTGLQTPEPRLKAEIKDLQDNVTFADGARLPEQRRRLVHALFEQARRTYEKKGYVSYDAVREAANSPTRTHEESPDLTFHHEQ